jgi:beta-glucosidase
MPATFASTSNHDPDEGRPRGRDAMQKKRTEVEILIDQMSLEEQVSLLSGEDFWSLPAIPRLGIGKLRVTDGPNGARGGGSLVGGVKSAAFPVGIALGATWDVELVEEVGVALAAEAKSKGAHVLLAPTVNIHRSVTNGRNFECYSEDPELTAALAVAYIRGLQGQGIAATIKHFAGNESETERTTMDSLIDERSLREVYLRPFEAAVKEAGTWAVMSSYNRLNGTYTAESGWLLTDVLRGDWGFDGAVMSDWFGSRSMAPTVNAGLDIEMPGPPRDRGAALIAAVEAGEVDRDTVRERALNVLRLMERTGALRDQSAHEERADDRPEARALIRRAGAAGMVLLKNDGILPLAAPKGTIAVIGPNAQVAQIMGGGSAQLNPHYAVSPWDGLAARLGEGRLVHEKGCTNHRWEPLWTGDLTVEFFTDRDFSRKPAHVERLNAASAFWIPPMAGGKVPAEGFGARITGTYTPERDGIHRFGVAAAGYARLIVDGKIVADAWDDAWVKGRTFFEEGCDEVVGEVALAAGRPVEVVVEFASKRADSLRFSAIRVGIGRPLGGAEIESAARTAAQAETALVFVGRSGEWDTEGSDLDGITLPGRQDELVAAVLKANPRTVVVLQTGGPVELPWIADAPAILQAWYPGQECGTAIADVLFGDAEPGGRLPQTFPARWQDNPTWSQDPGIYPGADGKVRYEEGVFVGYRHYDRIGLEPLFPFGHGLGYTRFELAEMDVAVSRDGARVTVKLTNTGMRRGSTVVQIYVGDTESSVERPEKELKSFAKATLEAGETRELAFDLPPRAFAFFDANARSWKIEEGDFRVWAGFSATDLRESVVISKSSQTFSR